MFSMTSAGNFRNAAYNDHQSSVFDEARSQVPSTFLQTQQRDNFEREIFPADSASNVENRSATSSPRKANGFARTTTERRTDTIQLSVRRDARTRNRGPTKEIMANKTDKKDFRGSQSSRVTTKVIGRVSILPPKNEKALPKPQPGKKADLILEMAVRVDAS